MKKKKIVIEDADIISAFEELARLRNEREKGEKIKCYWTAETVIRAKLGLMADVVKDPHSERNQRYINTNPSFDWDDLLKSREKPKE